MDHVRRNILFEEILIVNEHSESRDGRPHCERRMACLTNIQWAPVDDLNVSAAMVGLTNVLWANMSCGRRWLTPHSPVGFNG